MKLAAVQAEPVWFDLQGSVEKAISLIEEAASNGADIIGFPELFVPGYPVWIWDNAADVDKNMHYIKNSLSIDSSEFKKIQESALENSINVVLGFSERFKGSLHISQAYIGSDGELKKTRRKIKATHVERAIFGDGKSTDLDFVVPMKNGTGEVFNVGGLNCWEHTLPLLTYKGATDHENVHVASWPGSSSYNKEYPFGTSKDGMKVLTSAYAIQNRSYVIFSNSIGTSKLAEAAGHVPNLFKVDEAGGSCIFGPDGSTLTPELDPTSEGIVYFEADMDEIVKNNHFLDSVGHYSRPDIISLQYHKPNENVVNTV